MIDLQMTINYDMKAGSFTWDETKTNVKQSYREELLSDFLQSQIGSGADDTPAVEWDAYEIQIGVDLSDDTFYVKHNCGNKGLRDGILMDVLRKL